MKEEQLYENLGKKYLGRRRRMEVQQEKEATPNVDRV